MTRTTHQSDYLIALPSNLFGKIRDELIVFDVFIGLVLLFSGIQFIIFPQLGVPVYSDLWMRIFVYSGGLDASIFIQMFSHAHMEHLYGNLIGLLILRWCWKHTERKITSISTLLATIILFSIGINIGLYGATVFFGQTIQTLGASEIIFLFFGRELVSAFTNNDDETILRVYKFVFIAGFGAMMLSGNIITILSGFDVTAGAHISGFILGLISTKFF